MSMFGSMGKKILKSIKIKKRVFDPEKMSIEDISLPRVLKNLDSDNLTSVIAEEISTFKSLGYKVKPIQIEDLNSDTDFDKCSHIYTSMSE